MISKDEMAVDMCKYMHNIVQGLVDNPEQVCVEYRMGEQTCVFEVAVDRKDLGKVIGKMGRTAKSLRTILSAVSTKHGMRSVLEIIE